MCFDYNEVVLHGDRVGVHPAVAVLLAVGAVLFTAVLLAIGTVLLAISTALNAARTSAVVGAARTSAVVGAASPSWCAAGRAATADRILLRRRLTLVGKREVDRGRATAA